MPGQNAQIPPPDVSNHEILKWIGGGSYGDVWLARNIMGIYRAVKVVRRASFDSERPYEREFEGLRNFEPVSRTSEGFTDILQIGRNDAGGYFFYVMEIADGLVLGQNIDENAYQPKTLASVFAKNGRFPFQESLNIALSLSDAVRHLHEHDLVHRDIKPSNIIFVNGIPKLADIGLVTSATNAATFLGAPGYIAPEGPGTKQADIYSLGKVVYEISTGNDRLEFPKPPLEVPEEELSDYQELNEIVLKACESDPRRRYSTVERMQNDLVLLRGGKSVRRLRFLEQTWGKAKRTIAVSGVIGVALILYQMASLMQQRREKDVFQLSLLRSSENRENWFSNAWNHARVAKSRSIFGSQDALRDVTAGILAGVDAHPLRCFSDAKSSSVVFDSTGERLLLGGFDGGAAQLKNGKTQDVQLAHNSSLGPFSFSRSGDPLELLFDLAKEQAAIVNPISGRTNRLWSLPPHIVRLSFGSWSNLVAAFSKDAASGFAGVQTKSGANYALVLAAGEAYTLGPFSNSISAVAISNEGEMSVAAESGGEIHVWSANDHREVDRFLPGRNELISLAIAGIPFSKEGLSETGKKWLVASGDAGGNATIWEVGTHGAKRHFPSGEAHIFALAFSPDGTVLASGGRGPVRLWDAANGQLLLSIGCGDYVRGLDFSADGNRLAVAREEGSGWPAWELEWGHGIRTLRGLSGMVSKICFCSSRNLLGAFSHNWEAAVWNVCTGRRLLSIEVPRGVYYDNAALGLSPNGHYMVFSSWDTAKIWDVSSGNPVAAWTLPAGMCDIVAFPNDDTPMLFRLENKDVSEPVLPTHMLGRNRVCRIWKLSVRNENAIPEMIAEISDFRHLFTAAATSDGKCFVVEGLRAGTDDPSHLIAAYQTSTGARLWSRMSSEQGNFSAFGVESTGDGIAVSTNHSRKTVLVHGGSGAVIKAVHTTVSASALNGNLYVNTSDDGIVLWCEERRKPSITFLDSGDFCSAQFDASGNLLAWGNPDGTVTLCNLPEIRQRLTGIGMGW